MKNFIFFLFLIFLISIFPITIFAEDTEVIEQEVEVPFEIIEQELPDPQEELPTPQEAAGIPDVSTKELVTRINKKGNDVLNILQSIGKWICISVFVICAMLLIIGIIGNKKLMVNAFLGLLMSGIAYAGVIYGREIVIFIATWASS